MTSPELLAPTACCIVVTTAAKNGAMTTMTAAKTAGQKARGPDNFVDVDQISSYAAEQTF
jgi:hypothetical protein